MSILLSIPGPVTTYIALYARHGCYEVEDFESKDEAIAFLNSGSENGECAPVAVVDLNGDRIVWKHTAVSGRTFSDESVITMLNTIRLTIGLAVR